MGPLVFGIVAILVIIAVRRFPREKLPASRKKLLTRFFIAAAVLQIASWITAILGSDHIESWNMGECPSPYQYPYTVVTALLALLSIIPVLIAFAFAVKEKQRRQSIWLGVIFLILITVSFWSVIVSSFCLTF